MGVGMDVDVDVRESVSLQWQGSICSVVLVQFS